MNSISTKALVTSVLVIILVSWTVGCSSPASPDRLRLESSDTREGSVIVTQVSGEEDPEATREAEKQAARYQARRIGELLGHTAHQNSFTDFPYDALDYDLLEPGSNWITDDNMDADDTFIPFDSASVDRGDGWTEHSLQRSRSVTVTIPAPDSGPPDDGSTLPPDDGMGMGMETGTTSGSGSTESSTETNTIEETREVIEYITAYSDAVSEIELALADAADATAEMQSTPGEQSTPDTGTENMDDPWVHFGWWLETPEDEEPPNYRFATFVDGGNRYSFSDLRDVAAGTGRYEGPAAGVYVKREPTTLNTYWGRFNAKVDLTAEFHGADNSDGRVLSLEGGISNFVDGDSETALHDWSATLGLYKYSGNGEDADLFGSVVVTAPGFDSEGTALYGTWQAHFHEGSAWYKGDDLAGVPGTVAGQFRAFRPRLRADASPSDSGYFEQPIVQSDSSRHFDDQGFLGLAGAFGAHLRSYYEAH